jgi:hypothetical protein
MVLQARDIGKPQIELLGIVLSGKFQDFLGTHWCLLSLSWVRVSAIPNSKDAAVRLPIEIIDGSN